MKIVLRAFGNKLQGVMEVPEDTGPRFRLAMIQPIQAFNRFTGDKAMMMDAPIDTVCEFEWSGSIFSQKDHPWDGAREYQLVAINK